MRRKCNRCIMCEELSFYNKMGYVYCPYCRGKLPRVMATFKLSSEENIVDKYVDNFLEDMLGDIKCQKK